MTIKSRATHAFVELSVDEINTTIFKSDKREAEELIRNLLSVIDDLTLITNKTVAQHITENFQ